MTESITTREQFSELKNNQCVGSVPVLYKSRITFAGSGNILYCEEGVRLDSCKLHFAGDNGLVILGKNKHPYIIDISVNNNCSIVFGRHVYFNGCFSAVDR